VAVQDLCFVLVPRRGCPVPIQHQGPAPPVNHHLVVKRTQEDTIPDAGAAPVGLVPGVVHLAR